MVVNNNLAECLNNQTVGTDAHIGPPNLMIFKRSDVGIAPYTISINLFYKLLFIFSYILKLNAKNTSEEEIRRCCFMLLVKNLCVAAKAVKIIKCLTVLKVIVAVFALGLVIKNTIVNG